MIRHLALQNTDRRRSLVDDLRFVAELIEDGLPAPLAIEPPVLGQPRLTIQIASDDLADWLLYFEQPMPTWQPVANGMAKTSLVATKGSRSISLISYDTSGVVNEVTC